jgi:hypothetical protein
MKRTLLIVMLVLALVVDLRGLAQADLAGLGRAHAQTGSGYDLTWSTIDGGGVRNATGGAYTLGGTIGQPDASVAMNGGDYTLAGGFWGVGASQYKVYLPLVVK